MKIETEDVLRKFLQIDTWYTGHPLDMNRWYNFVNTYSQNEGFTIDETSLKEKMLHMLNLQPEQSEYHDTSIITLISLAYNILDFLKHTNR